MGTSFTCCNREVSVNNGEMLLRDTTEAVGTTPASVGQGQALGTLQENRQSKGLTAPSFSSAFAILLEVIIVRLLQNHKRTMVFHFH